MYWYIKRITNSKITLMVVLTSTIAFFISCSNSTSNHEKEHSLEFDLPSFFNREVKLLNSAKPIVKKTVEKDGISESKELTIADWERELANFLSVDLNKPAYQGYVKKDSFQNNVMYTIANSTLDLTSVQIMYKSNKPISFIIKKSSKNLLYQTDEILKYNKGIGYSIDKTQKVKGLNKQHYKISGIIETTH